MSRVVSFEEYFTRTAADMSREKFQTLAAVFCLVHGVLYITLVFAAGVVLGRPIAMQLAAATAALVYLSSTAYGLRFDVLAMTLNLASWLAAACAGAALLV
jgi:ABC-type transport system involved in multi-copper enzyme maturation permease subunit